MARLFILLQWLVPQQALSRLVGWLARSRAPWIAGPFIRWFARHYEVDMTEAAEPGLAAYTSFNDFFTRALAPDARPLDPEPGAILCPADGAISQIGDITGGSVFQAKGRYFSAENLLADVERADAFHNGHFATIYLSPKDYHRVHMPLAGKLVAQTYIPGDLFSVNPTTANHVDSLFARNERLVCYFDTAAGPMAMVLVGAMIVAGISTVWGGQVAPPLKQPVTTDFTRTPAPVSLERGEEMGRFMLGSTVILLLPEGSVSWDDRFREGAATRMGARLGMLTAS
ncbi:MAG: archaetidylserine decarboxylase [Halieaceae bacterium]|nr:archaetidylserine decarboxylase [Halieaceae bacterium]